ncbi:hypothetical protein NQ315_015851 [Exocentrus adspersus]|uniref:Transmembrane protein 231 n=1 Tax=Exocentrus adspersus TaxID=1586481 RepID=A0AAV8W3A2_9CUCU|nr:hypothetical protein NQ315_015851 [Exocentrus adspersus]
MVIFAVYTNQIKVKYKSTLLSKAAVLVLSCGMLSIVLPFIFAYKSGGFWLKRDTFHEQPQVNLRGDYLLIAATNNLSSPVICSSYPFFKHNLDFLDVCSVIKLREVDDNFDGRIDKINLDVSVNTLDNKVVSVHLFLPINYKLNTVCPLQMQSAVIFQQYFQTSVTDLKILADLSLLQTGPIQCYKKGVHSLYDYPVVDESYEWDNIIERYWFRNISTQLTNVYTSVRSADRGKFNLKLTVRYPEHKISYRPGFWQVMKWAWMQYFAIYIIIAWFFNRIKRYTFNNRLVWFYKDTLLLDKNE